MDVERIFSVAGKFSGLVDFAEGRGLVDALSALGDTELKAAKIAMEHAQNAGSSAISMIRSAITSLGKICAAPCGLRKGNVPDKPIIHQDDKSRCKSDKLSVFLPL